MTRFISAFNDKPFPVSLARVYVYERVVACVCNNGSKEIMVMAVLHGFSSSLSRSTRERERERDREL